MSAQDAMATVLITIVVVCFATALLAVIEDRYFR